MADTEQANTPAQEQGTQTTQPPITVNATGTNGGETEEKITLTASELQQRIDTSLKERLQREREKADKQARQAREEAEQKELAEKQEFQTLAEKREARIKELEPQLEQINQDITRYQDVIGRYLAAERKGVPDTYHSLLDKLAPLDQLEWIAANREKIRTTTAGGIPSTPRPDGSGTPKEVEEMRERMKQQLKAWF